MKRSVIIAASAVALTLGGTTAALAATGSIPDSGGVIHAC
jgi:hypothetical protein